MVAAMVTFTTMTRFVDEERTNAGIFKALGYRNRDIVAKFVLYGFLAGTVGTIIERFLGIISLQASFRMFIQLEWSLEKARSILLLL